VGNRVGPFPPPKPGGASFVPLFCILGFPKGGFKVCFFVWPTPSTYFSSLNFPFSLFFFSKNLLWGRGPIHIFPPPISPTIPPIFGLRAPCVGSPKTSHGFPLFQLPPLSFPPPGSNLTHFGFSPLFSPKFFFFGLERIFFTQHFVRLGFLNKLRVEGPSPTRI